MIRRPPRSTRTDTLFPYTTLFRSGQRLPGLAGQAEAPEAGLLQAVQGARQVHHAYVGDRLEGAGGRLGQGPALLRGALVEGDHGQGAEGGGRAQDRAHVVRTSDERRVGTECVSTVSYRWSPGP